ncbi:MAG: DUF1488 family protein [Dongiaceae bacterium]
MVRFDSFAAYDSEKDVIRFRCHYREQMVLCAVTRAALVLDVDGAVSTRAELMKLYEMRSETIQRAVLKRLQSDSRAADSVIIVDVDDVFQLKRAKLGHG